MVEIEGLEGKLLATGQWIPTCSSNVKKSEAVASGLNNRTYGSTSTEMILSTGEIILAKALEGLAGNGMRAPTTNYIEARNGSRTWKNYSEEVINGDRFLVTKTKTRTERITYGEAGTAEEGQITNVFIITTETTVKQKIVSGDLSRGSLRLSGKSEDFIPLEGAAPDVKSIDFKNDDVNALIYIKDNTNNSFATSVLEDLKFNNGWTQDAVEGIINNVEKYGEQMMAPSK